MSINLRDKRIQKNLSTDFQFTKFYWFPLRMREECYNLIQTLTIFQRFSVTKQNLKQVKGPLRHLPYSCDTRVKFFKKGPPIPQVRGVIYSNIYKRMANLSFIARMSLTGVGCRLQTCSRLASERFNSAFCAPIFTWEQTLTKKKQQKFTYSHQLCDVYRKSYVLFL